MNFSNGQVNLMKKHFTVRYKRLSLNLFIGDDKPIGAVAPIVNGKSSRYGNNIFNLRRIGSLPAQDESEEATV